MELNDAQILELATAFQKFIPILAGTAGMKATRFLTAEVKSVDEDNRTCVAVGVMDNEEITYNDVNLSTERNDGVIEIPAIDSTIMIAKMPDGETYVIKCSDVTKWICFIDSGNKLEFSSSGWVWNGGSLGGMAKTAALATQLNNVENKVNSILLVLGTTWVPIANDGGAALKTLCVPPLTTPLTTTTQAGIEDTKIKH